MSVWDFPHPPRVLQDTQGVVIGWSGVEVARIHRAMPVLAGGSDKPEGSDCHRL